MNVPVVVGLYSGVSKLARLFNEATSYRVERSDTVIPIIGRSLGS